MLKQAILEHNALQTFWNRRFWARHIQAMLKLTFSTTTHSSHAETGDFDQDTFQTCWNWCCRPQHIPAMRKLRLSTTKHSSHAETGYFDHDICITDMTILTTTHSSHAEIDFVNYNTFQPQVFLRYDHLKPFKDFWNTLYMSTKLYVCTCVIPVALRVLDLWPCNDI
jgi:hypothetical protein